MAFSVVMPALEMAQETGKLVSWRKKEGDRVAKGEPLLEIETDKAVMEVEAPADGILVGVKAAEGAVIPVGQTIAWIVSPGETPPRDNQPLSSAPVTRAKSEGGSLTASAAKAPGQIAATGAKISPKARRLAKELGVDITTLDGSGPGGEILASDVQARSAQGASTSAVSPPSSAHTAPQIEVPGSIGRLMAERTTQSWTSVPHFFVTREVEAGALNAAREPVAMAQKQTPGLRLTLTDLLVALVARVLLKHPRVNASWSAEGIRLHDKVNIGVAIAVNDGVAMAVIHDAHTASLADICSERHAVTERARSGKLRPSDIAGATFTISNLGMYHVDSFSAIITPPQAAILAVGVISDRVVAIDGKPAIRSMMTLTLSCDHRVADGARAAVFMNDLAEALREPQRVLDDELNSPA
jgi:pyruvate dehydrogenase E2 component (dihydrolipoyllysine-residue acetyltransferase)